MLVKETLKTQIMLALSDIFPKAFEQAFNMIAQSSTAEEQIKAKAFGLALTNMLAEPLADGMAGAIDYYVKSISISGTVITTGSPVTQTAVIVSPSPLTNGIVPNSLKIQ